MINECTIKGALIRGISQRENIKQSSIKTASGVETHMIMIMMIMIMIIDYDEEEN